jgi:pimeloyl-ACP methyl ester carboxylesterase/DNA-binding CsgD family transcriptional regulator
MTELGSEIRFLSTAEGVRVAYRVLGHGPVVVAPPWMLNHLEVLWETTDGRTFFEQLAEHFTVVLYDRPGCGLSDRSPADLTTEAQIRTLESVVDHLALPRFSLFAYCDAGAPAVTYAARHRERVDRLVLFAAKARTPRPDDPHQARAAWEASKVVMRDNWEIGSALLAHRKAPGRDPSFYAWLTKYYREATDPETAIAIMENYGRADVRDVVGQVRTPTLVLHRRNDPTIPFEWGRELAAGIPGARFVPLEGTWQALWQGGIEDVLEHTIAFLTESTAGPPAASGSRAAHTNGSALHTNGASSNGLSAREQEVIALIAAGKTDAQIAEALTIASATASRHVHNILEKLGMSRRSEAAAWWAANGNGKGG